MGKKDKRKEGRENNQLYYLKGVVRCLVIPRFWRQWQRRILLRNWQKRRDADYIRRRVDFYCHIPVGCDVGNDAVSVDGISMKNTHSRYYFDIMQYLRGFPRYLKLNYVAGDVWHNPDVPTIMKARRLDEGSSEKNCVLLKVNYRRHFIRPVDPVPLENKIPKLFFRGEIDGKPRRVKFMEMWAGSPLCDLGDTTTKVKSRWYAGKVSLTSHFDYKFILAVEGNDLATAVQWILASNCIPVMTRPSVEGWLMHSRLLPDVHYIEISDDFSDVEEKLTYYISHPDEAERISEAGKEWAAQFLDSRRERIINYLVLERYFRNTGQL